MWLNGFAGHAMALGKRFGRVRNVLTRSHELGLGAHGDWRTCHRNSWKRRQGHVFASELQVIELSIACTHLPKLEQFQHHR